MTRGRDKGGSGRNRLRHQREQQKEKPARRIEVTPNVSDEPPRRFTDSREVRRLLAGIGQPDPAPFRPDPFQMEALAALEFQDVLVTAPTGSGKTWIAREEIRRLLSDGRRAWYTSPLKALTNSKFQEFSLEFGSNRSGY